MNNFVSGFSSLVIDIFDYSTIDARSTSVSVKDDFLSIQSPFVGFFVTVVRFWFCQKYLLITLRLSGEGENGLFVFHALQCGTVDGKQIPHSQHSIAYAPMGSKYFLMCDKTH
jgi:hypothetical protein